MKRTLLVLTATALCLASCAKSGPTLTVAAKNSNEAWVAATATEIKGGFYKVKTVDGEKMTLPAESVAVIPAQATVEAGKPVFAQDADGFFYPGTVQEVNAEGIVVAWASGAAPAAVKAGAFTAEVPAEFSAGADTGRMPFTWKGSEIGNISSDGWIWLNNRMVGQIDAANKVYISSAEVGYIDSDGKAFKDGKEIGSVSPDGKVTREGKVAGTITDEGKVMEGGEEVGTAAGIAKEKAAAIFYLFFGPEY